MKGTTHSIQPASLLGVVGCDDVIRDAANSNKRFHLSFDESGFSTYGNIYTSVMDNILATLQQIKWTVFNVLISDDPKMVKIAQHLDTTYFSRAFCIVKRLVISSTPGPERTLAIETAKAASNNTAVFLLLTSPNDTRDVLHHFQVHAGARNMHMKYVFTPWNKHLHNSLDVRKSADTYIVFQSALAVSTSNELDVEELLTTSTNPWSSEFVNLTADIKTTYSADGNADELRVIQSMVGQLVQELSSVDLVQKDMSTLSLETTKLFVSACYTTDGTETLIGVVDGGVFSPVEKFYGAANDKCHGWCPDCSRCQTPSIPNHSYLQMPGDVIITGLFPLHSSGSEAFSCGQLQKNSSIFIDVAAFMFALETAKSRYPHLLPGISVGGLVLDTCSDAYTTIGTLADFYACAYKDKKPKPNSKSVLSFQPDAAVKGTNSSVSPTQNLGFIVHSKMNEFEVVKKELDHAGKYPTTVYLDSGYTDTDGNKVNAYQSKAISDLLEALKWTMFLIVSEISPQYSSVARTLEQNALEKRFCIVNYFEINETNTWELELLLKRHEGVPVVLLASTSCRRMIFTRLGAKANFHTWIINVVDDNFRHEQTDIRLPLGSLLVDSAVKWNSQFSNFLENQGTFEKSSVWFQKLWSLRFDCYLFKDDRLLHQVSNPNCPSPVPPTDTDKINSKSTSEIIVAVDAILHATHDLYEELCPAMSGPCYAFGEVMATGFRLRKDVAFQYQQNEVSFNQNGQQQPTLMIYNVHRDKTVTVGKYFQSSLDINTSKILVYTPDGEPLPDIPERKCDDTCVCVVNNANSSSSLQLEALPEHIYWTTKGRFKPELWAIIVTSIAGAGILTSMILAVYIIGKVCKGTLVTRHVTLGMLLLFAILILFTSVFPFVITPNASVCGLRFFYTGLAYALVHAAILVKLMTLQNYKLIGLGGEVSILNQIITVFFIVVVQLAFGVQWWTYNNPTYHKALDITMTAHYACNFHRHDFAMYLIYVLFLLLSCVVYATGVRREKKNLNEAKYLLAYCWLCVFFWAAMLVCLFVFDKEYSDPIISASILANAVSGLLVVIIPKMHLMTKLRYDISQKKAFGADYSIDTDFFYERPYSLPGTLSSSYIKKVKAKPMTFNPYLKSDLKY